MVFNTVSVGAAITPAVVETYFSHYLNRKPLKQKPTAHISYHEGINLIRQFLSYASHHRVEDIQSFTSQWVPSPRWVKVEEVDIPERQIGEAADAIIAQLGHHGVDKVGGQKWWQWRREGSRLQAEWIEMRRDYNARKGSNSKRVMLYVHGGAYFFGSVDEHRYQIQRHARKLEARVLAPRYRLAPQFPFPCGLLDCLAAYLYLLTIQHPTEVILAGDSAGGGMIVSLLVILRDRGLPLPAGAVLISPWVDLTHSFPSVAGDNAEDYIPSHGFLQRPSASWPPPNADDMKQIAMTAVGNAVRESLPRRSTQVERREATLEAVQGFSVDAQPAEIDPEGNKNNPAGTEGANERPGNTIPGPGHDLSIMIDGKLVTIKDQIQMYTTNQLVSHPLVSPILQPSLGGLPPLLILTGGGEVLRDEQIYLAHKAANPSKYPPGEAYLNDHPEARDQITKWRATDVQLQVWDGLCHVAPTLSFTRPAKFMYRSVAQFSAWALARAQKTDIEIQDDDEMSVISSGSESESEKHQMPKQTKTTTTNGVISGGTAAGDQIGKAGDALPPFKNHMIRQRVDRHGNIFPLEPALSLPGLQMSANEVGVIKPGPVSKWLEAKKRWDTKYAHEKRKVQKQRVKEMAAAYQSFGNDDVPPPSALAGRRHVKMAKEGRRGRSWGMSLWSLWGSSHDEQTMEREEKADKEVETSTATHHDGVNTNDTDPRRPRAHSRSKSRRRTVSYTHQNDENNEKLDGDNQQDLSKTNNGYLSPPAITHSQMDDPQKDQPMTNGRPTAGQGKAFPFKLGSHLADNERNASTITLQSQMGVVTPKGDDAGAQLGEEYGSRPTPELGRRETTTDAKGVLHAGLADNPKNDKPAPSTAAGQQLMSSSGDERIPRPTEGTTRHQTMEDAKGVLHAGVVGSDGATPSINDQAGDGLGYEQRDTARSAIERFKTAQENI